MMSRHSKAANYKNQFSQQDYQINQDEFQKAFQSFMNLGYIKQSYQKYQHLFTEFFTIQIDDEDDDENDQKYTTRKGSNIHMKVNITKQEALKGIQKSLLIQRSIICPGCRGNSRIRKERCNKCRGDGFYIRQSDFQIRLCTNCDGSGTLKKRCSECKGSGQTKKIIEQKVVIKQGVKQNSHIYLNGKGNQNIKNGLFGNVVLTIKINTIAQFTRKGDDSYKGVKISIAEAVLGCQIECQTLWGKKKVNIKAGTQDGSLIKLKNEGFKRKRKERKTNDFGDHFVQVQIQIPTLVKGRQKELFGEIRQVNQD